MLQFPTWKKALVGIICALGVLYAAPNFFTEDIAQDIQSVMPEWGPGKQINLGLDLRGGSYLLLEVQADVVVEERLDANVDAVRQALLGAQPRIGYRPPPHVEGDGIVFSILDPQRVNETVALLRTVDSQMRVEATDDGAFTMRFAEDAIAEIKRNALTQSIEIVRRRIDETGTREPVIQRQGDDRILVQLPGIDDPERVKDLLGQTAKLTFRMVDDSMGVDEARRQGVPVSYTHLTLPTNREV